MIRTSFERLETFLTADRTVIWVILLNAVVLFAMAFEPQRQDTWLHGLDYSFTTYFVLEASLKIRRNGLSGYFAVPWNIFDFVLVALSLPSYALLLVDVPDLSFLLLLRIARVIKFLRFIRFIPDIGQLLDGIRRALRASVFVILAFFVFTFVLSLLSFHIFRDSAPQHFGDPLLSFYSTFRVFTIEGWYEIPDDIAASSSAALGLFARIYFMVCTVGGGILGVSLINAIFVDEMLRNENDLVERRLDEVNAKLDDIARDLRHGDASRAPPGKR